MLDLKLSAKLSDHSIGKVGPIVSDDPSRETITADEVVSDEAGYHILGD